MARTVKLAKFQQPGGFLEVPEDFGDFATQADIDTEVSDHEAAADPHPGYLTQAEADALYAAIGAGGSADERDFWLFG